MEWHEYRPNNMRSNPLEGYYAIENVRINEGKKDCWDCYHYTIMFEYPIKETEDGILVSSRESGPEYYVLFLERLSSVESKSKCLHFKELTDEHLTLDHDDLFVNNKGDYIHTFKTLEEAKKMAEKEFENAKRNYAYVRSFFTEDDEH